MKNLMLLLLFSTCLMACSQDSRKQAKGLLGEAISADFEGKPAAIAEINSLYEKYVILHTARLDSLPFSEKLNIYSKQYIRRYGDFIVHALNSEKQVVEQLPLGDILQIMNLRSECTKAQLTSLTTEAVMDTMENKIIRLGLTGSTIENLIFVSETEAIAGIKTYLSGNSAVFYKENGAWKIDPLGDPTAQAMKVDAYLKQSGQRKADMVMSFQSGDSTKMYIPLMRR